MTAMDELYAHPLFEEDLVNIADTVSRQYDRENLDDPARDWADAGMEASLLYIEILKLRGA